MPGRSPDAISHLLGVRTKGGLPGNFHFLLLTIERFDLGVFGLTKEKRSNRDKQAGEGNTNRQT